MKQCEPYPHNICQAVNKLILLIQTDKFHLDLDANLF